MELRACAFHRGWGLTIPIHPPFPTASLFHMNWTDSYYHLSKRKWGSDFGTAMSAVAMNAHRSLKFPIIFYGYETSTLILRKGKRLTVFENTAFR